MLVVTKMLITLETHTAVPHYGIKPLSSPADQETAASKGVPRPAVAVFLIFRYLSSLSGFQYNPISAKEAPKENYTNICRMSFFSYSFVVRNITCVTCLSLNKVEIIYTNIACA